MAAITPKDVELISNIKEMQRRELQEKPGPGSSAAPAGKKASTPAVGKRAAAKIPTSRTPKTYANVAASTPSTTPASATRISPTIVEDELDLEDMDSFRIPRISSAIITERLAWEAERRKMQKMMEVFNQQEIESEEQDVDEDEEQDWPPSTRRAVRAKFNYLFEDKTGEDQGSRIYTARNASKDAYLKAHWTEWSAIDIM